MTAAPPRAAPSALARAVRVTIGLLALAFVVWTFRDIARRWDPSTLVIRWPWVVASLLPHALGVWVLARGFALLLERLKGAPVPTKPAVALHIESQLARYVPGKLGVPLVRIAGADGLGVTRSAMASAVLLEILSFLSVGGLVGSALLVATRGGAPEQTRAISTWLVPVALGFVVLTVVLVLLDRRRLPSGLLHRLGLTGDGPLVPMVVPLTHVLYWLTWALHGGIVCLAVGAPLGGAVAAAGLFVLAPIAGFLALVAPAGAGVREAVLSAGLVPAVGASGALSAALLSRGVTLLIDFGMWLVTRRRSA